MASTSVVKAEIFDVDALKSLCQHSGVSKQDKQMLNRYRKRSYNGNTVQVVYEFGKNWQKIEKGRICPNPYIGLAIMPREIRAALAKKHYFDIDMVNAQPAILNGIAKSKYGLVLKGLSEYVDNRATILEEIKKTHNMTRDEAKEICIAVIFGGFRDEHPVLVQMKKDLDALAGLVAKDNQDIFKNCQKIKKESDPHSSCLATWVQDFERQILTAIDKFLSAKGRPLEVLIYDGGLVRIKEGETSFPSELLRGIEQMIFDQFGVKIEMAQKPIEHSFDFKTDGLVPDNIIINDAYAAEKFIEIVGDDIIQADGVIYTYDAESERWSNNERGLRLLVHRYRHQLVFRQMVAGKVSIFDYGGCEKKIYPLLAQIRNFVPKGELPIKFEFEFDESPSDDLRSEVLKYLDDLFNIISDNSEEHKTYLIKSIADIFQFPRALRGQLLILLGTQGCGKDTLYNYVMECLGSMYSTNYGSNNEQFFSKFDTGRMGRVLVKLEEANRKYCLREADALKGFVTSEKQVFNPKGLPAIEGVRNNCRIIFTTNSECPVEFSGTQRRYVLFRCSNERTGKENNGFWDSLHKTLSSPGAKKAIAEFFLGIDLAGWDHKVTPTSEYQLEMSAISQEPWVDFYDKWNGKRTQAMVLYRAYQSHCENSNVRVCSQSGFFKKLALKLDRGLIKTMAKGSPYYRKSEVADSESDDE